MQNTNPWEQVFPTYPGLAWQQRYDATRAALDSPARLGGYMRAVAALSAESEPAGTIVYAPKWMAANWRKSRQRILLIPGSFNPLTWAHVALATNAWLTLNPIGGERPVAYYLWSGAISTVAKEQVERAAWADRLAQLVTLTRASIHQSGVVLFNKGLYLDQARALRTMVHPESELVIVVGFDKIVQIFDERYYEDRDAALHELFSLARMLVAPRDSAGDEELRALLDQPENRPFADRVEFMEAGSNTQLSKQMYINITYRFSHHNRDTQSNSETHARRPADAAADTNNRHRTLPRSDRLPAAFRLRGVRECSGRYPHARTIRLPHPAYPEPSAATAWLRCCRMQECRMAE